MTSLTVIFPYALPPPESSLQAFSRLRQVYGVQKTSFNEQARTIRVDYDASRLTEQDLSTLLRSAGIDIRAPLAAAA